MSFPQKSLDTTDPTFSKLSVENPDHILYQHDVIEIAIPGGIRTDILDRMRVTLKVKHLSIRHNLDVSQQPMSGYAGATGISNLQPVLLHKKRGAKAPRSTNIESYEKSAEKY